MIKLGFAGGFFPSGLLTCMLNTVWQRTSPAEVFSSLHSCFSSAFTFSGLLTTIQYVMCWFCVSLNSYCHTLYSEVCSLMLFSLPSKLESWQKAIRIFGKDMVSITLVDLEFSVIL